MPVACAKAEIAAEKIIKGRMNEVRLNDIIGNSPGWNLSALWRGWREMKSRKRPSKVQRPMSKVFVIKRTLDIGRETLDILFSNRVVRTLFPPQKHSGSGVRTVFLLTQKTDALNLLRLAFKQSKPERAPSNLAISASARVVDSTAGGATTHGRAGVTRSGDATSSGRFNTTLRPAVLAFASGENGLIQPGFVRRAEITSGDH